MSPSNQPALLVIDVQKAFDNEAYWGGGRNNPHAEESIAQLIAAWRAKEYPIFHVQHCSVHPTSPLHSSHEGNAFKPAATPLPNEPVIQKSVNSAFIGTNLQQQLETKGISSIVIVGLITNHCVSTTARMAANLGFQTTVVSDATATFDRVSYDGRRFTAEEIHEVSLASLHNEFATIANAASVIASLEREGK
jgi:nicotinamidase-related amidase